MDLTLIMACDLLMLSPSDLWYMEAGRQPDQIISFLKFWSYLIYMLRFLKKKMIGGACIVTQMLDFPSLPSTASSEMPPEVGISGLKVGGTSSTSSLQFSRRCARGSRVKVVHYTMYYPHSLFNVSLKSRIDGIVCNSYMCCFCAFTYKLWRIVPLSADMLIQC